MEWRDGVGAGLHNLGNTCFMNATLQCLAHTPPLAKYMQHRLHSAKCKKNHRQTGNGFGTDFCAACRLENLVNKIFMHSANAIAPRDFADRLPVFGRGFRLGRQEDAHEFLRGLLEQLTKTFNPAVCRTPRDKDTSSGKDTVVQRWFQGHLQSQVCCMSCGAESNTLDPFLDLSLELHAPGESVCRSLTEAMHRFTKHEYLEGDNGYKCGTRTTRDGARLRARGAPCCMLCAKPSPRLPGSAICACVDVYGPSYSPIRASTSFCILPSPMEPIAGAKPAVSSHGRRSASESPSRRGC